LLVVIKQAVHQIIAGWPLLVDNKSYWPIVRATIIGDLYWLFLDEQQAKASWPILLVQGVYRYCRLFHWTKEMAPPFYWLLFLDKQQSWLFPAGCFLMNCKQKLAGHAPAGLRDHKGHSPIEEMLIVREEIAMLAIS